MDKREGMCFVLELLFAFSRTKFARSRAHVCFVSKKEAIRVTAKHLWCLSISFSLVMCVDEPFTAKR